MTGTPHDLIETEGLDPQTDALVRDWFLGKIKPMHLDGERSVHLAAPHRPEGAIKIKGAGLNGKSIDWTKQRATGPKAPLFDFEGRFMEDVAAGHDNAFSGGASFQQARVEAQMSTLVAATGRQVVPCIGTGRISYGPLDSWFSVFDWHPLWKDGKPPAAFDLETFRNLLAEYPEEVIWLSLDLNVVGYHWYVARKGQILWKDLHPFRSAGPVSLSALAWVLHVCFAIHIRCNLLEFTAVRHWNMGLSRDVILWPLERLVPGVTLDDHAALRRDIVLPYMIAPPRDFSVRRLANALAANPITAALLERCPSEYARW